MSEFRWLKNELYERNNILINAFTIVSRHTYIDIWTDITRMQLKKIAKQLLFISKMPKLCAVLQLVSAPLNPVPIEEQLRWSHHLKKHSNWTDLETYIGSSFTLGTKNILFVNWISISRWCLHSHFPFSIFLYQACFRNLTVNQSHVSKS